MESDKVKDIDSWSRTKARETVTGNFSWTIENFLDRNEKYKECLISKKFAISGPDNKLTWWRLRVYPNGNESSTSEINNEGYLSIFLRSANDFNVRAHFELSLLDSSNLKKGKRPLAEASMIFNADIQDWGYPRFIKRDVLPEQQLLSDNNLTIYCEVTIFGEEKTLSGSKYPTTTTRRNDKTGNILQSLSDDFSKAFSESDCSDVHINCGGKIFNCHEFVLSARSPVFRAMFQNNMTERKTKSVTIADNSLEVIEKMLQFMYSGKVDLEEQSDLTGELLKAADKYELEILKKVCEDHLCDALVLKNSIKNLILGEMYRATKLMKNAMELLASNMSSVIDTEEWESCTKHHPSLVTEVMRVIVDKKGTKRKADEVE